mgnify:CR=1 FL=1
MNKLKIALVKQEVYQDLYVCPVTEKDPGQILFSSMGRVGPIALMSDLNADFYIVKEESNKETRIYQKVIPHIAPYLHLLKTETLDKIPGQEFKKSGKSVPEREICCQLLYYRLGTIRYCYFHQYKSSHTIDIEISTSAFRLYDRRG